MKTNKTIFRKPNNYEISAVKKKVFFTFFALLIYRLGNNIALHNIDQVSLTKSLNNFNPFAQPLLLYTNDNSQFVTLFFLGIGPYINSSFLVDLLTPLFFENFLEEEGAEGQKKLMFLKKILCILFASIQGFLFLTKIQSFFYSQTSFDFYLALIELIAGSLLVVWLSTSIENYGIGKGTSLLVLLNILISGFETTKNFFFSAQNWSFDYFWLLPLGCILFYLNRAAKLVKITNAKQSEYLKNEKIKKSSSNFLKLKLNRAGIFPLIIASNIFGFVSFFFKDQSLLGNIIYYLLIFLCTFFYNSISFDCEKISENFRKQSVFIVDDTQIITPGTQTVKFLEKKLFLISLLYSAIIIFLFILFNGLKYLNPTSLFFSQLSLTPILLASNILSEFGETFKALYYQEKLEDLKEQL